jgi:uncharacterized membrane protein YsdA (DUF1294 family)
MPSLDVLIPIAAYAIIINFVAFLVFAWDKHCARNGMWRVSERSILSLATIGGTLGVIVGQRTLRHKTRKEPFRTYLLLIIVIQVIGLMTLFSPQVRNFLWNFMIG